MKLLQKLKEKFIANFKTDVLGEFKNILIVGENNNFQTELLSELNQYFNIFHIYAKEKQNDQKLIYQSIEDNKLSPQDYLNKIYIELNQTLKTKNKIEFDAILNFDNILTKNNFDKNYLIQNQNFLNTQIERNMVVLELTRQYLSFKGNLINIVDHQNFSGSDNDIINNLSVSNQMDLFYRLSNIHQDINDHRFLYLITEEKQKLKNSKFYHKQIVKLIFKWILRRGLPDDNSIIYFKQDNNNKILPKYLQIIYINKNFLSQI